MPHVRCSKCQHRRTLARHPSEYLRLPRCRGCGRKMHADPIDKRDPHYYVDRWRARHEVGPRAPKPCNPGRGGCNGYSFPHRRGSRFCFHNHKLTDEDLQERHETGAWA